MADDDYQFDPLGYFSGLGNAMTGQEGWRFINPFTGQPMWNAPPPSQTQPVSAPWEPPAAPEPSPKGGGLSGFFGSDTGQTAAILGGLAAGFASPRIGPQALQNFSALNIAQYRQDQLAEAEKRYQLSKEVERRRLHAEMAKEGVVLPDMDPGMRQAAEQEAARIRRLEAAFYGDRRSPQGMQAQGQTAPQPAPQQMATQAPPPAAPPDLTQAPAPYQNVTSAASPSPVPSGSPDTPLRMEAVQDQEFLFKGPPEQPPTSTTRSLSRKGMTITQNEPTITPQQFETQRAVSELSELFAIQDDAVAGNPRGAFRAIMSRYPNADAAEVRKGLSEALINAHNLHIAQTDPTMHPANALTAAFAAARKDLGLLFTPPDAYRSKSTDVASIDQQRAHSIGQPGGKAKQQELNLVEGAREAAITGSRNTADFYTQVLPPDKLQQFENPPPYGATGAQIAGKTPMSAQRKVNVETGERERTQTEVAIQQIVPAINGSIMKAEQLRKAYEAQSGQSLLGRGANWLDAAQSQLTGFPVTEFGQVIKNYDDFVKNNGVMLARAYQGQKGNLTEQERKIGELGLPQKFAELYNNPTLANDRLAVMSNVLALELRDANFRLPRLDVPATTYEKAVYADHQARVAANPGLFGVGGLPSATTRPSAAGPALPPPPMDSNVMTPDEQSAYEKIQQEINKATIKKQKP